MLIFGWGVASKVDLLCAEPDCGDHEMIMLLCIRAVNSH